MLSDFDENDLLANILRPGVRTKAIATTAQKMYFSKTEFSTIDEGLSEFDTLDCQPAPINFSITSTSPLNSPLSSVIPSNGNPSLNSMNMPMIMKTNGDHQQRPAGKSKPRRSSKRKAATLNQGHLAMADIYDLYDSHLSLFPQSMTSSDHSHPSTPASHSMLYPEHYQPGGSATGPSESSLFYGEAVYPAPVVRRAANARERDRTFSVNSAFLTLRTLIPTEPVWSDIFTPQNLHYSRGIIMHLL